MATCDHLELSHVAERSSLAKAWIWHRWSCRAIPSLPSDFFGREPWIHPSGSSFVFMAWKSAREPFSSDNWLKEHLSLLHVAELSSMPAAVLNSAQTELAHLDRGGQRALTALNDDAPFNSGTVGAGIHGETGAKLLGRGEYLFQTSYRERHHFGTLLLSRESSAAVPFSVK